MFGPSIIDNAQLETILKDGYWQPTQDTSELSVGDEILMSIGTWRGRLANDDWHWVRGYVVKTIIKSYDGGDNYKIVKLGKNRNSVFAMTIDSRQEVGACHGRIYKRLPVPELPDAKLEVV